MSEENKLTGYQKLTLIQKEIKASKDITNDFGGFNYRNVESIYEAAKPLIDKYGCSLIMTDDIVEKAGKLYVKATAKLIDSDPDPGEIITEVSAFARETESRTKFSSEQLTGSASSYARKYCLGGLFLLDDNKDVDSMKPDKPQKPQQKKELTPETPEMWKNAIVSLKETNGFEEIEKRVFISDKNKELLRKDADVF
ncbi:MAG: ERF family protein [Desulfobacteraceae bacterium]|nr:ERF family protein [Desulfobacteraceae bacterium]